MWIVSHDRDFYPYIEKFKTYDKAKERYEELKENLFEDDCVFLSEATEHTKGKDYDIEYED